ncbi:MAG: sugar ABC transporter ATP-binding protein [Lachnospiraceae bacterium]|nr:sugar ABC transporter ATP-binding protein [Lachnospiraceae bacterium]
MEKQQALLEVKNLTKIFPGVVAVDHVNFEIRRGEVHVLIGENGAGKSTLVKMIAGIYKIDEGELVLDGESFRPQNVLDAQEHGINMVHQELSMMPNRTVAQNIFIGREPLKGKGIKWVDTKKMNEEGQKLLDGLGVGESIDASAWVKDLSIALQQMVEVAKATSTDNKLLILDEPTSSLTAPEIKALFGIIEKLKERGLGIIYISHRMNEIFEIGDRITVMRDGKYVGTKQVKEVTVDEIINMMIGRNIGQLFDRTWNKPGELLLETKDLRGLRFKNVNIKVHAGEIVGVAGLVGAGRTEVAKAIFGYDPIEGGALFRSGEEISAKGYTPEKAIARGIAYLSEDRKQEGLFLDFSIADNIVPVMLSELFQRGVVNRKKKIQTADEYVKSLSIATTDSEKIVGSLSGGNQQKVALAKWLLTKADLFIFDEPTRGIDIGAKAEIYALMDELVKAGAGILMISSEMTEICGVSDRIYAMHDGEISGELIRGRDEFSEDNVLAIMLREGGSHE